MILREDVFSLRLITADIAMSTPDEQKKRESEIDDDTIAPDEANADDGATMADPDDTASVAAPDDGATFLENTMAPKEEPLSSPGDDPPRDSATLPLDGAVASPDDGATMVGDDEAAPHPPVDSDATIGDAQLMREPSSEEDEPDATMFEPDADADQTLADPGLAGDREPSAENDGATMELPDEAGSADVQQTMFDESLGKPGATGGATSDATLMESVDNPDATQMEDSSGASADDHTVMESEYQSASGGDEYEGTQVLDESAGPGGASQRPRRPKKKGAHETADRWEYEQRYQLVSNFARGGLGQIWMANDSRLRREVAFKELLPSALKNRNAVERFLEEAQITGQLEHPGIVPIYDIGYQQNGTPFYAMKLVRGDTMEKAFEKFHELPKDSSEWLLTRRKLLGNFIDVCNAIAFAHDRGVLHRDLKPLNVMLGAFGETLVLDWGLAKVLDELEEQNAPDGSPITANPGGFSVDGPTMAETGTGVTGAATTNDATQIDHSSGGQTEPGKTAAVSSTGGATGVVTGGATSATSGDSQATFGSSRHVRTDVRTAGSQTMMGSVMGTPAYMPPEQAKGKLDEVDARTDIYSLGGILYKLLTNHQPIQKSKNIKELLKRVINGEIIPLREHDSAIEKPLEAICLKALARKSKDRYQSALELAADVEAFLASEPVSCFEDPPIVKAKRWARKNPKTVSGSLATMAAVVAIAVGSSVVHASALAEIRSFAATQVTKAESAAADSKFEEANTALTEAIGRAGSEPDLVELKQSLENRQALIEQERIQQLKSDSKRRLLLARDDFRAGRSGLARTSLAETLVLIGDDEELADIRMEADELLTRIEATIAQQAEVDATQKRFEEFRSLADETRARGSMPGRLNQREDATLALKTGQKALALFGLIEDARLAEKPKWFGQDLPWAVDFEREFGKWPLDVLRTEAFELMILLAGLERELSAGSSPEETTAATTRALAWVKRAQATGIQSQIALVLEADALRNLGRDEEADKVTEAAKGTEPTAAFDFFLLGEDARKARQYEQALNRYMKVVRLEPGHFWTRYYMGLCYFQLGHPRAAVSAFSNAATLRPAYAWPVMFRGLSYFAVNMPDEALADFEAAVALEPDLADIYINRGFVYLRTDRYEEALADFQKAAQLEPDSARPHINIAAWHNQRARQIREGEGEFKEISDLERIQQEAAEQEAALDSLDKAGQADGATRNPAIIALRAKILSQQGNEAVALDLFESLTELATSASDRADTFKRIGFIHFRNGRFAPALLAFEQADRSLPNDPETIFLLGEAHLQLKQIPEALRYYEAFDKMARAELRSEINRPEALYTGIATALSALQKKDEAIEYYTLAIKHNPNLAGAITRRGWAYASSGLELARADFENAKKQNPENADTLIGLGFTLAKLGDWKAAEIELTAGFKQAETQLQDPKVKPEVLQLGWTLYFNAATGFAQAYNSARGDSAIPTEERQEVATRLYVATLSQLGHALNRAAKNGQLARIVVSMESDRELNPVRNLKGFVELLQKAKDALKPPPTPK
jgi:serine/threonine protein kinase/tetratricopeptide (TPR) repeat protein